MITRERMFVLISDACPSFVPEWDAVAAEWSDAEPPSRYAASSTLARHIIGKLEAGDTDAIEAVFDVVERWFVEGDGDVREAAAVGLLEDLQNLALHRRTKPEDLTVWLRPVSKRWWDEVEAFWVDGTIIRDG